MTIASEGRPWDVNLHKDLAVLYGATAAKATAETLRSLVSKYRAARLAQLKDRERTLEADWYAAPDNTVYVLYADRFNPEVPRGRKLEALQASLGYFEELGTNILHILPVLASTGDGGFAVKDFREIDDSFGSNEEFVALVDEAHNRRLLIALDFVLNHVADEHEWAMKAKANDAEYRSYFVWDETKTGKDWKGVPEIFPKLAPGHWDYVPELDNYVWATFYKRWPAQTRYNPKASSSHDFGQWDLNYANPAVLCAMAENLLFLANWGVDIFRLDAAPFLWKKRGTPCTSLPQVFVILRVLRAVLEGVAPRTVLLAEANEGPDELARYYDGGAGVQMAYQFAVMPYLWQAVLRGGATTGVREDVERILAEMPRVAPAVHPTHGVRSELHWWILSECHDEVSLEKIPGEFASDLWHRFRAGGGAYPFRQLEGEPFPRGVSGTTYSLLGGDTQKIERLWELKLALAASAECRGTPLFFMGEELGVENRTLKDLVDEGLPPDALDDTRHLKRVPLTEELKARRLVPGTKEHILFSRLKALLAARRRFG